MRRLRTKGLLYLIFLVILGCDRRTAASKSYGLSIALAGSQTSVCLVANARKSGIDGAPNVCQENECHTYKAF
jgi:hypothetical protein